MNLNKALIIGRLTKDPEARTTTSGKSVTSMTVATSTVWKDQSGEKKEKTEFHDVVLWGKVGEIAAQYLTKGQEVYIEGQIETRNWEGQDGVKRYKTEIIVGVDGKMQMGSKPKGGGTSGASQAQSAPSKGASKPSQTNKSSAGEDEEEIKIEDIPF
jgi:single-strand DNA-binding protein